MMRLLNVVPRYNVAFRPQTRLFDRFFSDWVIPSTYLDECDWTPASDIAETNSEYHVTMKLPGIDIKKLDICLSEGVQRLRARKQRKPQ